MKKILFVLGLMLICQSVFAARVIYNTTTHEIVAMGDFNGVPSDGDGNAISDGEFVIPPYPLTNYLFEDNQIVLKPGVAPANLEAQLNFQFESVVSREAQVIPPDRIIALSPYAYTINTFLQYKNFSQLKTFLQTLVSLGIATQDDYDTFVLLLQEQGITL